MGAPTLDSPYRPPGLYFLSLLTAALFTVTLTLGSPRSAAASCFESPADSKELWVRVAPDTYRGIRTLLWKTEGEKARCTAHFTVELSVFPSSSLATRPAEIAATLRETAEEWDLERCTIFVNYHNDTQEEFEGYELCLKGEFRFDKGAYWSTSSEGYCWEPSDRVFDELDEFDDTSQPS